MRLRLLPLLLLPLLLPVEAREQLYAATEHESQWQSSSSRLECTLTHAIPTFGVARFSQRAGEELAFTLSLRHRPLHGGEAMLVSMPPSWKHDAASRDIGRLTYYNNTTTLSGDEALARRLLLELGNGMFPTLTSVDWVDQRDQMQVAISAVRFHEELDAFAGCLADILPYGFDAIRSSQLHFRSGESRLTRKSRKRLDELALYLVADPDIEQIRLVGHTDSKGRRSYNRALGTKRAAEVRRYLVVKGVAEHLFTLSSLGEAKPVASNRSSKGRARNRRVTINLSL